MVSSLQSLPNPVASYQRLLSVARVHNLKFLSAYKCRGKYLQLVRCSSDLAKDKVSPASPALNSTPTQTDPIDREGRSAYNPPSYNALVADATKCVLEAIKCGETKIEVDFPPPGGSNSRLYFILLSISHFHIFAELSHHLAAWRGGLCSIIFTSSKFGQHSIHYCV